MKFREKGEMIKFAQIFTIVKSEGDCEEPQRALVVQGKRTENQQMKFKISKCYAIQLGKKTCQNIHMLIVTKLIGKENPMSLCRTL